jgi:hypothetical protein
VSESNHTAGPWKINKFDGQYWVVESHCGHHVTDFVKHQDAPLIAAAPDLLEVVSETVLLLERLGLDLATRGISLADLPLIAPHRGIGDRLTNAIAKATGERLNDERAEVLRSASSS